MLLARRIPETRGCVQHTSAHTEQTGSAGWWHVRRQSDPGSDFGVAGFAARLPARVATDAHLLALVGGRHVQGARVQDEDVPWPEVGRQPFHRLAQVAGQS